MTSQPRALFVREATGLVREFGLWPSFIMAMANFNLGADIAVLYYAVPATFPSVDLGVLLTVALPAVFFWFLGYAMMTAIIPRSGGDYVWAGRALSAWGGFAFGIFFIFNFVIGISYNAYQLSSFYISQAFAVQGLISGNPGLVAIGSWLSSPNGIFVVGTVGVLAMGIITLFGSKPFKYVGTVLMVIALGACVAVAVAIAAPSHTQFVSTWNSYYTGSSSYQSIIQAASQQGLKIPTFNLFDAFAAIPFTVLIFSGFQTSVYIAGETKRPGRTVALAMAITTLVGWAFMVGLWYVLMNTAGRDFVIALSYLASFYPSVYPLPVPPTINFIAGLASNNALVSAFIGIGFSAWMLVLFLVMLTAISRGIFAMSFDRLIPLKFAQVSERLHAPIYALIAATIAAIIVLGLMSYTSFVSFSLGTGLAWAIQVGFAAVAMIVFPFRRKSAFELGPSWARKRFGPIPVLTIAGVITLGTMLFTAYEAWITTPTLAVNLGEAGVLVAGFLLYPIVHYYRKRQAVDLSLLFSEIPPE